MKGREKGRERKGREKRKGGEVCGGWKNKNIKAHGIDEGAGEMEVKR